MNDATDMDACLIRADPDGYALGVSRLDCAHKEDRK